MRILLLLLSSLATLCYSRNLNQIHTIRGGAKSKAASKTTKKTQLVVETDLLLDKQNLSINPTTAPIDKSSDSAITKPAIHVQAILLPRQTSFLTPLRFLSFLLINVSLNACMQTSGQPLEDAVRKLLHMPVASDGTDSASFTSKVTPLHIYVAKKIATSSLTLPPGHLPSPLPLLGLFLSIVLYVGGTVLTPLWNVNVHVLFNYERFQMYGNEISTTINAGSLLENWYNHQHDEGEVDPYYLSSKKHLVPAVLVYEDDASDKATNKATVCKLYQSPGYDADDGSVETQYLLHPRRYYFELNQKRYYYDPSVQNEPLVSGGPTLHEASPSTLLSDTFTRGLRSKSQVERAEERFGSYSRITIPVPTLQSAFVQRMTSPLIAMQMVGRILSLIEEESIGRAFANMARLIFQHFVDSKRSVAAAITLAEEAKLGIDADGDSTYQFWAVRPNGESSDWVLLQSSDDLLPADIFFIDVNENGEKKNSNTKSPIVIPVDAMLLDGSCVTEEAALTGETVPQAKIPLDLSVDVSNDPLDMTGEHRTSCIFAGTKLLYSSNEGSELLESLPPLPPHLRANTIQPTIYLTLRTGSYSSRGEIIQAMTRSKMNMGLSNKSNEKDSMRLIGALTTFAVSSCFLLLLDRANDEKHTSVFKRMVQCIRIIVASIPSDLSSSLAASEHECATILREEFDVVGTESGALVSTAKTDAVVFDKTGTLTADTQSLTSIVYPPSGLRTLKSIKFLSNAVLAGAHTLIQQSDSESDNLVGDPVDLASLQWTRWKYIAKDKSASSVRLGEKLWQIRSFPFDSNKKISSAIVLTKDGRGNFRLWILLKGSPNTMKYQLFKNEEMSDLALWYDDSMKRLGSLGYRSICLGALDVSNTDVGKTLFPSGLPKANVSNPDLESFIHDARINARVFHRNDIEKQYLDFVGFACFNAPMRESTPRIVQELKAANIDVIMLTGDEPYASFACAAKAGIAKSHTPKTHFLRHNSSGSLVWESNEQVGSFSFEAAKSVERDISHGGTLIASGDAVSSLLKSGGELSCYVRDRILPHVRVVASASPKDKCTFISWLKLKKHVLMCGDGVNDIAAMTKADTSAAMLSGFGSNSEGGSKDFEDTRRKERLKKRRIGSNRLKGTSASEIEAAGIGNSPAAIKARIQRRILEGVPVVDAIQEEFNRRKEIRKGGSTAARIMEKEARLSKSMKNKALSLSPKEEDSCIQTGEACLASSFTLLRPCISGIDSILRAGIAAASSGIGTYRKVALSCILSSYNLATLYRNGLRYGKWMWQAELFGIIFQDRASFMASSTPRPRLTANVRPSETFNIGEVLSTLGQAIVHIATLTLAVKSAKQLQKHYPSDERHTGFGIKWSSTTSDNAASVGAVLSSLTGSTSTPLSLDDKQPQNFFRRTPFQPNFVSNAVFIVSIFQNAVITMVNHGGRPFSVSFLESRPLCLSGMYQDNASYFSALHAPLHIISPFPSRHTHHFSVGLSFVLAIACLAETLPIVNNFIQLAPFPKKSSKVALLRLLLFNISSCYFIEYFSTFIFRRDIWRERNKSYHAVSTPGTLAADEEDLLLLEERKQNIILVYFLCLMIFNFALKIFQ